MKQCPTCHQPFTYDLLKFCRFDGSPLVSATPDEATTMLLPPAQHSDGNLHGKAGADRSARNGKTPAAAK